uniref:Uncharacterized protein n=1 Tax=Rhizophora mucronata TaxID=61149 RepID=A0A2P2QZ93_RHIMU
MNKIQAHKEHWRIYFPARCACR